MNCTGAKCPQPKRGKALPATNLSSCQKRGGRCAKRSLECRREQENHSQKVCNANQIFQLYQGIDISTKRGRLKSLCVWYSVSERASYGTEYACRAQKGFLWYATHFQKHSVLKTGFYGTEEIFGAKNRLLWYATHLQRPAEQPTPQTVDSLLGYATHFQRRAVPKAASCRTGRIFSARNGPRSEVSRHKKETKVKDFDLFCRGTVTRTQDPLVPNQMR